MVVNALLFSVLNEWYPLPIDEDLSIERLGEALHRIPWPYALIPIGAHAAGTFSGCWLAALRASPNGQLAAWVVCALFMVSSISVAWLFPLPATFVLADILLAYAPMAWLAIVFAQNAHKSRHA